MPNYRRYRVPGGCYFFTVNLLERHPNDLLVRHIDLLRAVVRRVRRAHPFHIDAWVVLPDHLHCVWTLPPGDGNFSLRWRLIKTLFAKQIPARERRSKVRQARGERGLWQRHFWEQVIRSERDYAAHLDYVHYNPVKHGYAVRPTDWPFSTFRRCVQRGFYAPDWGGVGAEDLAAGERGD